MVHYLVHSAPNLYSLGREKRITFSSLVSPFCISEKLYKAKDSYKYACTHTHARASIIQIDKETNTVSSGWETAAIFMSAFCSVNTTISYEHQRDMVWWKRGICVYIQKARGKCNYLRNSWDHSRAVCQPAWLPAEAPVSTTCAL